MMDSFLRQRGNNFINDGLRVGRHVVDRNDQEVVGRTCRRDNWQKLCGYSRGHFAKFSTPLPIRTSANYFVIFTIVSKSRAVSGITERRDWRTSAIFLSCGSALISASVTGRGK